MALTGWVADHTGMPCLRFRTEMHTAYQVVAEADGRTWVAARGMGDGSEVLCSDPLAPIGVPVTYTLGGDAVTLTRAPVGGHALTDESGHLVATFRWLMDDATDHNIEVSTDSTSRGVADRWPLMPPPSTVQVDALTDAKGTAVLRELLRRRGRLILLHDPGECQVDDCDIPPVRPVTVSQASEARTARVPHAQRRWSLRCEERSSLYDPTLAVGRGRLPDVHAPVVVWGEWDALDGEWQARTYAELCTLVSGMPS